LKKLKQNKESKIMTTMTTIGTINKIADVNFSKKFARNAIRENLKALGLSLGMFEFDKSTKTYKACLTKDKKVFVTCKREAGATIKISCGAKKLASLTTEAAPVKAAPVKAGTKAAIAANLKAMGIKVPAKALKAELAALLSNKKAMKEIFANDPHGLLDISDEPAIYMEHGPEMAPKGTMPCPEELSMF
jgi:hypothetical protein